MLINKQLHFSLATASGLPRNFRHPRILLCDALVLMTWIQRAASEITAVTSVENYTFLWRQNHFSFGQTWGPGRWDTLHGLILPPEPQEGCAIRQFGVKSLHALMLISCAAGTPHSFGRGRGIPKVFTEELLQETLLLAAHRGQIPFHRAEVAWFRPTSAETSAAPINCMGLPFEERCMLNFQLCIFPGCHLEISLACSHAQRLLL